MYEIDESSSRNLFNSRFCKPQTELILKLTIHEDRGPNESSSDRTGGRSRCRPRVSTYDANVQLTKTVTRTQRPDALQSKQKEGRLYERRV